MHTFWPAIVAESGKKYRSDDTEAILKNLGLQETVNQASGALQKNQNGADIPGKDTFTKNIGACRGAFLHTTCRGFCYSTIKFLIDFKSPRLLSSSFISLLRR
ncbi:hypothetical protein AC44_5405 [Escherichia coli 2-177-06_S3_C3]|nr:hypothetical protein AC44_5405 [Escherichia coli 2-177-06_S3_C3]